MPAIDIIEEKLKLLLLFKVTDDILKKSKLTDEGFEELVKEYRESVARRYGGGMNGTCR